LRFLVLLDGHTCLGVPTLEVRLAHGAVEAEFTEKLLSFGAQEKVSEKKGGVWMRRTNRHGNSARVGGNDIHRHPLDRSAF
jgi:hypothetical protein